MIVSLCIALQSPILFLSCAFAFCARYEFVQIPSNLPHMGSNSQPWVWQRAKCTSLPGKVDIFV